MQRQETGRQAQARRRQRAERRLDASFHQVDDTPVARLAQRHHVAETGHARRDGDVDRPQEFGGGRAFLNERLQCCALRGGRLRWKVPFERDRLSGQRRTVDLALPAAAQVLLDRTRGAAQLRVHGLAAVEDYRILSHLYFSPMTAPEIIPTSHPTSTVSSAPRKPTAMSGMNAIKPPS